MTPSTKQRKDEILQSVKEHCSSLADKLEKLHHKVIKPVGKASDAVAGTVGSVSQTVSSAKQVVDSAGEHIAHWPWLSLAGSLAAGLGTGLLVPSSSASTSLTCTSTDDGNSDQPGFLASQFNKLTGIAVGAGLAAVRDIVKDQVPSLSEAADSFTRDLTEKLGAVPFTVPIIQPHSTLHATTHQI